MLEINIGIAIGIAAFGLLFYGFKKYKKKNPKERDRENDVNYVVQVADTTGRMVDLADRPVMVVDVIHIPYGANGSHQFHIPITGVIVDADYDIDPEYDGKFISVTHSGNTVYWEWKNAKALKPTNVTLLIIS